MRRPCPGQYSAWAPLTITVPQSPMGGQDPQAGGITFIGTTPVGASLPGTTGVQMQMSAPAQSSAGFKARVWTGLDLGTLHV